MPDLTGEDRQEQSFATEETPVERQRVALQDFLNLSVESVRAARSELGERFQADEASIQARFETLEEKIRQRLKKVIDAAHRQHEDRIEKVRTQYESDSKKVEQETKAAHQRLTDQAEGASRTSRIKVERTRWVAESHLEVTKTQLYKEFKRIQEEIPERRKLIDSIQQKAVRLLEEYRQSPPAELDESSEALP